MSSVVVYGHAAKRLALVDKLARTYATHAVIHDWDGMAPIPHNAIVSTALMPPFEYPLHCAVIGAGMGGACPACDD